MNAATRLLRPATLLLLAATACDPSMIPEVDPRADPYPGEVPTVSAEGVDMPEGFASHDVVADGEFTRISGITRDPATGLLYVSDLGELSVTGDEAIREVDPETGAVRTVVSGLPLGSPGRMFVSDGRAPFGDDLVVADWNTEETAACCGGRILRIDITTGEVNVVSEGSPSLTTGDPFGLALADGGFGGAAYVQDFQGASAQTPRLVRIDADGSAHDVLIDPVQWPLTPTPRHLVIGQGNGFHGMYILDPAPGQIWHVDGDFNLSSFLAGPTLGSTPATARFGLGDAFGTEMYVLGASTNELKTIAPDGSPAVFGTIDDADSFADMVFAPGCGTLYVGTMDRIIAIQATH